MEWVETTAKTIEAAREAALDQLGVGADEAEFDVIEEPRPGLFGRMRGEARLRARVRPTQARPKQERRRKGRSDKAAETATASGTDQSTESGTGTRSAKRRSSAPDTSDDASEGIEPPETASDASPGETATPPRSGRSSSRASSSTPPAATPTSTSTSTTGPTGTPETGTSNTTRQRKPQNEERTMSNDDRHETTVTPDEVGAAAVAFMDGLTAAFGVDGTSTLHVDDLELRVDVAGSELGLLVGPGGRTLNAIQDLARVSAQRRLGDHETRLRIDVAGYRERREAALAAFARDVAEQVRASGTARSLEPMSSSDRKVVHDALNEEDGVSSRSVGEDPDRRIIVEPA